MGFGGRVARVATTWAVALAAGCRSLPDPCDDCTSSGAHGEAGNAGYAGEPSPPVGGAPSAAGGGPVGGAPAKSGQGGEAGDAGAQNEAGSAGDGVSRPECTSDTDCDDNEGCDGAERCKSGRCEAGKPFTCPTITECFETKSGAACRYSASERFVVYSGDEFGDDFANAVAVPITRLDTPVQLNFSQGATDAEFGSIFDYYWSPDGGRLLYAASTSDFANDVWDQKYYWFDVRGAVEGQPRRVPNLPIKDDLYFRSWSASSNAVLIGSLAEQYAVRFRADRAETAQLPTDATTDRYARLCSDDATVAYSKPDGTHLTQAWDAPGAETVLPATLISRSPDGRWLLLSSEERAFLARCSMDSELEELGGPAGALSSWSPNSDYVVYSDTDSDYYEDPTPKALSAFRVESNDTHPVLFEAISADPAVSFEPDSTRFLYVEQTPEDELVFRLVDLAQPSAGEVLPLPPGIGAPEYNEVVDYTYWLGEGWLAFDAGDGGDTYVMQASASSVPRLVGTNTYDSDYLFTEDGSRAIWIESDFDGTSERSQAYVLELKRSDAEPHALFHEPLTGSLGLIAPRVILHSIFAPDLVDELFVVPPDFEGAPVRVSAGTAVGDPALQPQP